MNYKCHKCNYEFWKHDCVPVTRCEKCHSTSLSCRHDDDYDYDDYENEED